MGNAHNRLVFAGSPYTLRKTPVTPIIQLVLRERKPLINGMLGDPVAHGMSPYHGFTGSVASAAAKPENWGYASSLGHDRLRELIKEVYYRGAEVSVFIGAGVSGISDGLCRWMFGDPDRRGAIAIPRKSYILYFFDAMINGTQVQPVDLTPSGHIDCNGLEAAITKETRMVVITTTGNPIGTSMSNETVHDILEIIYSKERQFCHAIIPVFDVMYEGFRHFGKEADPIHTQGSTSRNGPVFVVDSLSKRRIATPGARLGWLAVYWPEDSFSELRGQFFSEIETLLLPRLGQVPTPVQIGLISTLSGIMDDARQRENYGRFDNAHIAESKRRVREVLAGLVKIPGVILPEWCHNTPGDRSSGIAYGMFDNSFYINFGFELDQQRGEERIQNPAARRFALFLYENGLPVVGTTPLDSFLPPADRGHGGDFMRIVALQPDNVRRTLLECVNAYAEHLQNESTTDQ